MRKGCWCELRTVRTTSSEPFFPSFIFIFFYISLFTARYIMYDTYFEFLLDASRLNDYSPSPRSTCMYNKYSLFRMSKKHYFSFVCPVACRPSICFHLVFPIPLLLFTLSFLSFFSFFLTSGNK